MGKNQKYESREYALANIDGISITDLIDFFKRIKEEYGPGAIISFETNGENTDMVITYSDISLKQKKFLEKKQKREDAMNKLTDEDREVLGLK